LRANGPLPTGTTIRFSSTPGFGIYRVLDSGSEIFLGNDSAIYTLDAPLDLGDYLSFIAISSETFELAPTFAGSIALPDEAECPTITIEFNGEPDWCQNPIVG
jgi:hypothetical protein